MPPPCLWVADGKGQGGREGGDRHTDEEGEFRCRGCCGVQAAVRSMVLNQADRTTVEESLPRCVETRVRSRERVAAGCALPLTRLLTNPIPPRQGACERCDELALVSARDGSAEGTSRRLLIVRAKVGLLHGRRADGGGYALLWGAILSRWLLYSGIGRAPWWAMEVCYSTTTATVRTTPAASPRHFGGYVRCVLA